MDSLKITSVSTGLSFVYWTDVLSGVYVCSSNLLLVFKNKKNKKFKMIIGKKLSIPLISPVSSLSRPAGLGCAQLKKRSS